PRRRDERAALRWEHRLRELWPARRLTGERGRPERPVLRRRHGHGELLRVRDRVPPTDLADGHVYDQRERAERRCDEHAPALTRDEWRKAPGPPAASPTGSARVS